MPSLSLNASKKTKHTPAGEIPVDWDFVLLDQLAKRGSGHTPSKDFPSYWDGGIKWVSLADSSKLDRGFISETANTISEEGIRRSSAVLHPANTVILSRDAGVGKSAVLKEPMAVSQHFIAWTCGKHLDPWYLYHWLQNEKPFFERMAVGSTIKTIGLGVFKKLGGAFPPLPEQIRIAAILSTWDRAIETLESLIAAKDRRKQALMQQLLTGRKRLPGFGGKWPVKHLGDLARNVSLRNNGRFGWDRLYAVTKAEGMIPMREQVMGITTKNCKLVKRDHFAYNPMRLNIGSLARWQKDEEVMVSGDYIVFECIEGALQPRFFDHLRRTPQWHDFVNTGGSGSVRVRLYFKDIAPFRFPCPSYKEQEALADLFDTIDRELTLHRQHLATLRTQKRGLMQLLLTGRVRISVI